MQTMGFFLAEGLYTIIKVFYISITDVSGKINAKRKGVEYKPSGDNMALHASVRQHKRHLAYVRCGTRSPHILDRYHSQGT